MNRAADATQRVKDKGDDLAKTHQAMTELGQAGMVMGAALGAGVGVAVAKFAEFDQAMSNVAATGQDARDNLDALRQAALDAGAETVFSATESANAIEEMAKAGLDASEILGGGLRGALDLAAAGGLGVADAAGIAATTLKQFNLEGADMSHVADLLAAGAGKAMGDVADLGGALDQAGLVANQFGLSIDETVGTLSAFASAGMLGSDAGTSMRTMLLRLANPTDEVAGLMESLGISAYDTAGNFIGLQGLAGELEQGLRGMTQAQRDQTLAMIFGQDAIRGANILLREGADGIEDWTNKVADQGYAAEVAAQRLDNLIGDWEAFTGALDTAFITMGEGLDGPLRGLVQGLTGLVDGFNDLPAGAQQAVLWVGLVTSGVGLLGGAALIAIPKIAALKLALETLGVNGATTRASLARFASFLTGPYGIALVAATTAIVALSNAQERAKTSSEEFQNTIKNAKSAMDLMAATKSDLAIFSDLDEALASAEAFQSKLDIIANNDFLRGFDGAAGNLKQSLSDLGAELRTTAQSDLPAAQNAFRMLAEEYDLQGEQLMWLLDAMGPYKRALQEQATALGINVTTGTEAENAQALLNLALGEGETAADANADATARLEQATADAVGELDDMKTLLEDLAGAQMSAAEAHDRALSSVNALAEAATAEGATLLGTNDASIRLRDSIRDVELAHRDSAAAILENGGTLKDAQAEWQRGRDQVVNMRVAMGESREEAIKWADQNLGSAEAVEQALWNVAGAVNGIPTSKHINITVDTSQATRGLDQWISNNNWRTVRVRVAVDGASVDYGSYARKATNNAMGGLYVGGVKAFAAGGMEPGIYPYTPGGLHKFAEEYDEAYLSMDPRRRNRSYDVWSQVGEHFGFQQSAAPVSLDGLSISGRLEIGGDGLARIIDGRVHQASSARRVSLENGSRG